MPLSHSYLAFFLFALTYLAHLLQWRWAPPRRSLMAAAALFLIWPLVLFIAAILFNSGREFWFPSLLHLLLCVNYLVIYPAFQASSPTIQFLTSLRRHPEGLTVEELVNSLGKEQLIGDRLQDLVGGKMIRQTGDRFILSTTAAGIAVFFITYRKILGLGAGNG